MKKFGLSFLLLAAAVALNGCGGGDDAANPNNAAEEFSNPTGKLTSSNKNKVGQGALDASSSNGLAGIAGLIKGGTKSPFDKYRFPSVVALDSADIQSCIETSGSSSTIDYACFAPLINDTCTGSGTVTTEGSETLATANYNNASISCTEGDFDFDFTCNGSASYALEAENVGYACYDLECSVNEIDLTFDGCTNPEGDLLIRVEGESYVVLEISTDAGCENVTTQITDSEGTKTLTCEVTDKDTPCSGLTDIRAVGSCTISD